MRFPGWEGATRRFPGLAGTSRVDICGIRHSRDVESLMTYALMIVEKWDGFALAQKNKGPSLSHRSCIAFFGFRFEDRERLRRGKGLCDRK